MSTQVIYRCSCRCTRAKPVTIDRFRPRTGAEQADSFGRDRSGSVRRWLSLLLATVAHMHFDEASKALVEFAASRHNAFHSSEVADNIPARRLRRAEQRGELHRLGSRVWSVTALGAPLGQATRAAVVERTGSAAAHVHSAWLHRWLDAPAGPPAIWVPRSARTGSAASSKAHRFWASRIDPALDITTVDHIATLNPAATLCLLGRVAPRDVVGDVSTSSPAPTQWPGSTRRSIA